MIIVMHIYLLKGTITVVRDGAHDAAIATDRNNKQAIFTNCAPFTNNITEINNTQVVNAKNLSVVMPMFNLIEYNDPYWKTSGRLYQFCRDEPDNNITDSESFKSKSKSLDNTNGESITNAKIAKSLKYFSNVWSFLEMPLINCETNVILTWSANCVNSEGHRVINFFNNSYKTLCSSCVPLSTKGNTKLLQQLKSGFKRIINWNEYQSKVTRENRNQYLD